MFFSDNRLDSSDKTYLVSSILKDGFYHIGGCGFSFCSCDSDGFQFLCRMSEPCSGNKRHGITGILHLNYRYIRRSFYRFLHNKSSGSLCHNIRHKFMSVYYSAPDADKKASLFHFTGIINNRRNFLVCTSLKTFVFKMFQ